MLITVALTLVSATLEVGPTRALAQPSAAAQRAQDGDVILIDAGDYPGDVATWRASRLTLRAVGGRVRLDAMGQSAQGKAIWVIQGTDTTVEGIDFLNATVPDQNGAGIRQEGANLVVRDCSFVGNQTGILAGDSAASDILIERSVFARNGAGDGQSHNMYINHVRTFTLRASYTHDAHVGHNIKSRAATTIIEGNRISSDEGGDPSYEIDLSNGGVAIITGNIIHQGPQGANGVVISFAAEGASHPTQALFVTYNTFVDARGSATFVANRSAAAAVITDNVFVGGGTISSGPGAPANNLEMDPGFVDLATLDLHLTAGSAAIGRAVDPGMGGGRALTPSIEYVHPASSAPRASARDLGAFESTTVVPPPTDAGVAAMDAAPAPVDAAPAPADDARADDDDARVAGDDASAPVDTDAGTPAAADAAPTVGRDAGSSGLTDNGSIGGSCAATGAGPAAALVVLALAVARRRR